MRPPTRVWLLHLCHVALLAGLPIGWWWELSGGILTLVSAIVFFWFVAGPRALSFLVLSAAPAVIWIALGLKARRS